MFCKPPHPPHPVYIVIFRGDDTDFVGNQEILVKIHTERDISGCKAYFKYMGNVQTFEEIPEDKELHLVFSREQTKDMPLGTWDAELYLIDEQGRKMTVNNRIHMLVTNSVHEAYFPDDPQAVTVVINSNKYVMDAEVSQDGKTLTLTKGDGSTVSFQGGGSGDVSSVNGKTGVVVLTGKDIKTRNDPDAWSITDKMDSDTETMFEHIGSENNPHNVTAEQVGAYSKSEADSKVDSAKAELNSRIDLIEKTSHPNMNIVGSPKFSEGVVSGFSANDYLMFPTQVDVGQNSVDFYMSFTTGADIDITPQENILDSWCGLAVAISGGHLVLAVSSNGTTFETSESLIVLDSNSSYRLRISFDYNLSNPSMYTVRAYIDDDMSPLCEVVMAAPLYPTATYWGGANPQSGVNHIFGGTINLNECRMEWNGNVVWRGYDELPTVKFDPTADPKLDTAEKIVGVIEDAVSLNNRFLVNGTTAAIQTRTDETSEWTDEIRVDKGYDALQGDAMVKLDKSVQTVTVSGGSLTVELPDAVDGTVRDLCLYINNTSPTETVTMTFPAGVTVYKSKGGDDPKMNAQAGGITAYYFTEIPGGAWRVMRDELEVAT